MKIKGERTQRAPALHTFYYNILTVSDQQKRKKITNKTRQVRDMVIYNMYSRKTLNH